MSETLETPAALDVVTDQFARTLRRHGDHPRSVLRAHNMTISQAARVCHAPRSTFARRLASGNLLVEWLWTLANEFGVAMHELVAPEPAAAR